MNFNSLNEIIFSNRNKEYGAYMLRKMYRCHLLLGLGISISVTTFFFVILLWLYQIHAGPTYRLVNYKSTVFDTEVVRIPKVPLLRDPTKAFVPKNLKKFPLEVVAEERNAPNHRDDSVTTLESNAGKDSALATVGGSENSLPLVSVSDDTTGTMDYSSEIYFQVDTPAEYPGGLNRLDSLVRKHLIFPNTALEKKINGIVYVKLVISYDGTPEMIEIDRGIDEACNKAVLKALAQMPKWTPARKNGLRVKQRLILPIAFVAIQ